MSEQHGTVHWTELMSSDVQAAKAYYATVCGWSYDEMPMEGGQTYYIGMAQGKPVTGLMDLTEDPGTGERASHWISYIAVDDVDAAVRETEAAGGRVTRAPWDVAGVGRIALVTDPTGAAIGLITPAPMPDAG